MLKKLLTEPLVHFAMVGALLFAVYAYVDGGSATVSDDMIVTIDAGDIAQIQDGFQAVWRRAPTAEETENLIEAAVREEILVREATVLGLDRGDAVIRQRLAQKMAFLLSAAANAETPTDEDLIAHIQAYPDRFRQSAQIDFRHVFLGESPTDTEISEALAALQSGADPDTIGQSLLLAGPKGRISVPTLDAQYGTGFAGGLAELEIGQWGGPIRSGYGLHLAKVLEITPAKLPDLDDVRGKAEADWRQARAAALSDAQYDTLSARYTVDIEREAE